MIVLKMDMKSVKRRYQQAMNRLETKLDGKPGYKEQWKKIHTKYAEGLDFLEVQHKVWDTIEFYEEHDAE